MTITNIKFCPNKPINNCSTSNKATEERNHKKKDTQPHRISTTTKIVALTSIVGGVGLYRFAQQLNIPILKGILTRLSNRIIK